MFDSNLFNPTYLLYHKGMILQEQDIGPPFTQLLLRTRRLPKSLWNRRTIKA